MLFNETIQSNIKFGDLNASDARVKEVAIQANALAFIMQNDEDYASPMIVARITDLFNKIIADPVYTDMKKVKSLLGLARNKTIDFKQLMFVC